MIRMSVEKNVGRETFNFTFEGKDLFEVVSQSQLVAFNSIKACGLCKSDLLSLRAFVTSEEKYEYVKILCGNCKAQATFGKAKKDNAMYLRKVDGEVDWQAYKETVKTG